jgi:hypothetical protein
VKHDRKKLPFFAHGFDKEAFARSQQKIKIQNLYILDLQVETSTINYHICGLTKGQPCHFQDDLKLSFGNTRFSNAKLKNQHALEATSSWLKRCHEIARLVTNPNIFRLN